MKVIKVNDEDYSFIEDEKKDFEEKNGFEPNIPQIVSKLIKELKDLRKQNK
ncbi:hypothetical protein MmarC5_1267 [Methanococcus maripaludis C5]|uniref:Uncharacterized protein n=1 Tax=Methanococcus maripaludis (strain C5 / ATCC BAA-1333) TaxID=402880 RepID=A4FZD1_METM5|nr:hypothetical protein [Methanococcus maripaludis]ABO35565.1 hypothetical protein MmarC5_1267 [Methanococcus maripaludis C5]